MSYFLLFARKIKRVYLSFLETVVQNRNKLASVMRNAKLVRIVPVIVLPVKRISIDLKKILVIVF